jgi:hypothetical protein
MRAPAGSVRAPERRVHHERGPVRVRAASEHEERSR